MSPKLARNRLDRLEELVRRRFPGARLVRVAPIGADAGSAGETAKSIGYGVPLRLDVMLAGGEARTLCLHVMRADRFGHDRRSDRAQQILLAWDTFARVPRHARALDVGFVADDGRLLSIAEAGEPWLLTEWAPGHVYADDLRRVAQDGEASAGDVARAAALARYLVALHTPVGGADREVVYTRAMRDLVGHGEGIFGIVDGYPDGVPAAPPERLRAIEARCLDLRWGLRGRDHRLRRTHGDFHPFNVLFDGDELAVLDASRGARGDPADDVTCMAVNYVFFALERPASWARGLGVLWRRFWDVYLGESRDHELLEVAAPFLTWRALVLANPRWYPHLDAGARDTLLGFAERALAAPRFEPAWAEDLFG